MVDVKKMDRSMQKALMERVWKPHSAGESMSLLERVRERLYKSAGGRGRGA